MINIFIYSAIVKTAHASSDYFALCRPLRPTRHLFSCTVGLHSVPLDTKQRWFVGKDSIRKTHVSSLLALTPSHPATETECDLTSFCFSLTHTHVPSGRSFKSLRAFNVITFGGKKKKSCLNYPEGASLSGLMNNRSTTIY